MDTHGLPARLDELIEFTRQRQPSGRALDHLTDAVRVADHLGQTADHLVGHFVDQARHSGASWTEIGQAIGVSKQAAQKRFVPRPEEIGADKALYDRLTDRAKRVAGIAQDEARRTGYAQVGSLHVLLALAADPECMAALAVQSQYAVLDQLRQSADERLGNRGEEVPEHVPFGAEAKKVMQISMREALRLGHDFVGTEHVLLALLRADDTSGARVLAENGVTRERSEQWVLTAIEGYRRARAGARVPGSGD